MNLRSSFAVVLLSSFLYGCAKPVPADKAGYVGDWNGPQMHLLITQDGRVEYKRVTGNNTASLSGPLQEFTGDNFSAGVWFLSSKFVVSRPPTEEGGKWTMVVDGVELTKTP